MHITENMTTKSQKMWVFMLLLILLILSIIINISSNILWGYGTISTSDEYRHFAKARQIAYGNIKVNQMWDDPQHYDLYPPGFHIFIASFMILTGNYDSFGISIVYRIMFSISISLLVFLIGRKVNDFVGLLSAFFYNTFFFVSTYIGRIGAVSYTAPYPHIASHQGYLATYLITQLLVFLSLLLYIEFIKSNHKNELTFSYLIILVSTAHGLSHISTYIGFLVNFGLFALMIDLFPLIRKNYKFMIKNIKFLLLILFSLVIVYFLYYYPMMGKLLSSEYTLSHVLPQQIPDNILHSLPTLLAILGIIAIAGIVFSYIRLLKKRKFALSSSFFSLNKKVIVLLTPLYILLYISILSLVTEYPQHYNYSGFQLLNGVFPTYIPSSYNFLSFYSLLIGLFMFLISTVSIFFALKSHNTTAILLSFIYINFYIIWYMFAIPIHYYADRIIYFLYILPFVYAFGVFYFFKKIHFLKNRKKIERDFKIAVISVFLIAVLFTNIMIQINLDPAIRENININNTLRIGVNNPPTITWSMCIAVNKMTEKNEYILASLQVGEALAGTTHIKPPLLQYNVLITDHKNWTLRHRAYFGDYQSREKFFEQYNARYLVVGVMDVTIGGEIPGQLAPIKKYNESPHLLLVYSKGYGERIYFWIN